MAEPRHDVAVVGAGVVGAACAFSLRASGLDVVLIDRGDPQAAASWGNAGQFAYDQVLPLATAGLWSQLPRLLLSKTSPFRIAPGGLGFTLPWLVRFLFNTRPTQVRHGAAALASLLEPARAAWASLAGAAGAADLIRTGPVLVVARTRDALQSRRPSVEAIRRRGIRVDELDAAAARAIEPALRPTIAGAFALADAQYCIDPGALTQRLTEALSAAGGSIARDDIRSVAPGSAQTVTIAGRERNYTARRCVLAAGIGSRELLGQMGIHIPLAAERGYHLMLPRRDGQPRVPIIGARPEFVITPMAGGLRLAGTSELAPPGAAPSWQRAAMLSELAQQLIGPFAVPNDATRWVGSRPTLPDSLPAIGALGRAPSIIAAFGHQHLGLTLAAVTADLVRSIVLGQPAPVALSAFAPERF